MVTVERAAALVREALHIHVLVERLVAVVVAEHRAAAIVLVGHGSEPLTVRRAARSLLKRHGDHSRELKDATFVADPIPRTHASGIQGTPAPATGTHKMAVADCAERNRLRRLARVDVARKLDTQAEVTRVRGIVPIYNLTVTREFN